MHTILFEGFIFQFPGGITILNNIVLLITRSSLSLSLATSSFKHLSMCTLMHAVTLTFITEALHLVSHVELTVVVK